MSPISPEKQCFGVFPPRTKKWDLVSRWENSLWLCMVGLPWLTHRNRNLTKGSEMLWAQSRKGNGENLQHSQGPDWIKSQDGIRLHSLEMPVIPSQVSSSPIMRRIDIDAEQMHRCVWVWSNVCNGRWVDSRSGPWAHPIYCSPGARSSRHIRTDPVPILLQDVS